MSDKQQSHHGLLGIHLPPIIPPHDHDDVDATGLPGTSYVPGYANFIAMRFIRLTALST
jgi:hypothetical protein